MSFLKKIQKKLDNTISCMLSSDLTFRKADTSDPVQASTVIEAYRKEWNHFDLWKIYGMEYKPSVEIIQQFDAQGALVTSFGFDTKGNLQAFYIGVKGPHAYNPEWIFCQDIILYLAPQYRKNPWVFKKFMQEIDKQMKLDGVDLYSIALPASPKFARAHSSVLKNGFEKVDILFMRRPQ